MQRQDDMTLETALKRGGLAREGQRHEEALHAYQTASRLSADSPVIRVECAHQLWLLGRHDEAEAIYRELAGLIPGNARVHRGLGLASASRGAIENAVRHYRTAIALAPEISWIATEFLDLLRRAGKRQDVAEFCDELESRSPSSPLPWIERARLAREDGNLQEARQLLVTALQRDPASLQALMMLAVEEKATGNIADALALCGRIQARDPANTTACLIESAIHREAERYREAEAVIEKGLARNGQSVDLHLAQARIKRAMGETKAALEILGRLKESNPRNPAVLQLLAALEIDSGNTDEAARHTGLLMQMNPDNPQPAIQLARHHLAQRRTEEARELLSASLGRAAAQVPALVELAELESGSGNDTRALELARAAAALGPDDMQAHFLVSRLLFDAGRSTEAIRHLSDHRELLGQNANFYARLGQYEQLTGQYALCLEHLDEGREKFPAHFGILAQWASCAMRCGQFGAVRAALDRFQPQTPSEIRHHAMTMAHLLKAEGQFAEAFAIQLKLCEESNAPPYVSAEAARTAIPLLEPAAARRLLQAYATKTMADPASPHRKIVPSHLLVGQIATEFLLDAEALQAAIAARAQPEAMRIAALLNVVENFAETTSGAIALCVELRRLGAFDSPSRPASAVDDAIPRNIFQFWDSEDVPQNIKAYCATWQAMNPGYGYRLFNRRSAADYLGRHASVRVQAAFRRVRSAAGKADIFRLAVLEHEGGIYCDADDRCLAPLDSLLGTGTMFVAHQEDIGSIGNNFLAAVPHHPVIAHALENAVAGIMAGANDTIWLSTGPGQLTRSFAVTLAAQGARWRSWLSRTRIMWWTELSAICAQQCFAAYKNTAAHWSRPSAPAAKPRPALPDNRAG